MAILFISTYKLIFVSGISMEATIKNNHLGLLHKNTKIQINDIICAQISNEKVIKRIVAVSGDQVKITNMTLYTLKSGEFFIIGDNYEMSEYYIIKKSQIVGELLF